MGLFSWFIPKKYKNKYKLGYITQEMYIAAAQANLSMYNTRMEKKGTVISDKTDSKFCKEFDRTTNETFKAVRSQEIENYRNVYNIGKLHNFQMERRLMCFERFKEILLQIEFAEEELYVQNNCTDVDVKCIEKMLKYKYPQKVEFAFSDIFYKDMMKLLKSEEKATVEAVPKVNETSAKGLDAAEKPSNNDIQDKLKKLKKAANKDAEPVNEGADEKKAIDQPFLAKKGEEKGKKEEAEGQGEKEKQVFSDKESLKKLVAQ